MEEEELSQDYLKGFNQGYSIQQTQPDLFQKLKTGMNTPSEYRDGFTDGSREYEMERIRQEQKINKERSQERDSGYER